MSETGEMKAIAHRYRDAAARAWSRREADHAEQLRDMADRLDALATELALLPLPVQTR